MNYLILCEWVPKWVFHNFKRTEATYQLLRLKGPSNIVDSYKIMKKSPMRGCFQAKTRTTFYRWCHHQCMTMWKFACSLIHCVGKHYYSFFLLSIDRHWGILIYNKIIIGNQARNPGSEACSVVYQEHNCTKHLMKGGMEENWPSG